MIKYNLSGEKLTPATLPRLKFVCACVHSWGEEGKSNLWRTCWVSGVYVFVALGREWREEWVLDVHILA